MEIVFVFLFCLLGMTWLWIGWNFSFLDKRTNSNLDLIIDSKKMITDVLDHTEIVLGQSETIARMNQELISAIPQARKNLINTETILELAQKQQFHLVKIRQDWLQMNMFLAEALEVASMIGGKEKPDEALKYLRLVKEKFGDEFGEAPPGVEVAISDSHTDKP